MFAKLATGKRFRIWQALQRQKHRRQAGSASLVIGALDDLSGLLAEFRAETGSMTFTGPDIVTWSNVAGSESVTLTNSVGSNPYLQPDYFGVAKHGVYFQGEKMMATVNWTFADLTAVFVGNLDFPNLDFRWVPRWLDIYNHGLGESDWNSPNGWVIACFDSLYAVNGFVADRNWARPIDLYFDPNQEYIVVTRKQAGTITAWLRPFGGATITMNGATTNAPFAADTLAVGGGAEAEAGLCGTFGHIGLWSRALTDTEVSAAMNYLGSIYE